MEEMDTGKRFTQARTKACEDLMRPEIRPLLNLPLNEKIKISQAIIEDALTKHPKIGLGFSGGTDSLILLPLVLPLKPDIPVIFVNTQHEFPETYKFIEEVKKRYNLNFYEVKANENKFEQFKENFGLKTPEFTTACCKYHKIDPMMRAIRDFEFTAFIVGLRGVEHEERAKETFFSPRETHMRIHPLLFWRKNDVMEFVKRENLICNPIYSQGYTSLGCIPCTEKNIDPNMHERAGRGVVRETIMERLRELGYT